jgi:phage gpG-like protein
VSVLKVKATKAQVRMLVASLPGVLSGKSHDGTGEVYKLQTILAQVALMHIKAAFAERADGGTDASGMRWQPLAASTIRRRRKGKNRRGKVQILRDTGILFNSLAQAQPFNVLSIVPGVVTIGTEVPYARYHQSGTARMPARRLWPEPENWPDVWWEDMTHEVCEGIPTDRQVPGGA